MYRSLLFKLGLIPLAFLLWGWRDSIHNCTSANCETAGYHLTVYHTFSLFHIEFWSRAAPGPPRNYGFLREKDFDGKTPFRGHVSLFPSPAFLHEVPDVPVEQLSSDDSFRAEVGERSGGITIPYWLVLLTYVVAWLRVSRFAMRKRKLGFGANDPTNIPHGRISP